MLVLYLFRADYWKSQPRKFCQYCKCWIADNKPVSWIKYTVNVGEDKTVSIHVMLMFVLFCRVSSSTKEGRTTKKMWLQKYQR